MDNGPSTLPPSVTAPGRGAAQRFLDGIEWAGNKLPDPAVLFVLATWTVLLLVYWALGLPLGFQSTYLHP